jgi:hypothetical protein
MILRSVTKHVKDQNWFAVVLDLVIVVFGVFIGIQVSNWNEMRLEEQKAETYIERLREDLAENKTDFSQRKAYFNQVRAHAIAASDALNQSTEILGEQFLIDIYQASQYMPRELGRDTYNEILSIGALNSDSNMVIRKRLSNFYRSIKAQLVNVEYTVPYRLLVRSIIPYKVQRAIKEACDDIISTGKNGEPILSLPESCSLDLTDEQITNAIKEIKNENIKHSLTKRISLLDTLLISIELILGRVELLDTYLKTAK